MSETKEPSPGVAPSRGRGTRYYCRQCEYVAKSAAESVAHFNAVGHYCVHRPPHEKVGKGEGNG